MHFKKIIHGAAFLICGSLILSSCQKKVLELQPYTSFSDVSAFSSRDRVNLAVNGVYDAAQSGFYAGGAVRGYPFGAANIEQGDMRGEDLLNNALFYQVTYESVYSNVTANNDFHFQTLYSLINKANLTIEGIKDAGSKNVISAAEASAFEGELRFLRALAHHELVIMFARPFTDNAGSRLGIIYRDFGVNSEAKAEQARGQKRTTVADNYTKILADLDFAETNLPVTPAVTTYRASRAAAIALKMRVRMHQANWAAVITEGNKLVPASAPYISPVGGFRLTATPDGPFVNNQSQESIFSIRNDAIDNAGVNGALASMLGDPAIAGRGLVRISPIIWSDPRWLCSDVRRGSTLVRTSGTPINAVFTNKYRDITNRSDAAPQIRYAEVLLMLAEAEARNATGVSLRGLELLNAVRNRSVTAAVDQFTVATFATKDALVAAILFERRVEFIAEGKRWGDIHRLALDPVHAPIPGGGIPSKVGTAAATAAMFNCAGGVTISRSVVAIPYADYRFIWPIPLSELQQNPNYEQNPQY